MLARSSKLMEARAALAAAEAKLELLSDSAESMKRRIAELEGIRQRAEQAIDEKMAVAADALQRAHELEVKNAVLLERIDLMVNHGIGFPTADSTSPRPATEDAEDIEYMFQAGLLDKEGLEKALEAAGLQNTEISLDFQPSDYPRLGGRT